MLKHCLHVNLSEFLVCFNELYIYLSLYIIYFSLGLKVTHTVWDHTSHLLPIFLHFCLLYFLLLFLNRGYTFHLKHCWYRTSMWLFFLLLFDICSQKRSHAGCFSSLWLYVLCLFFLRQQYVALRWWMCLRCTLSSN